MLKKLTSLTTIPTEVKGHELTAKKKLVEGDYNALLLSCCLSRE